MSRVVLDCHDWPGPCTLVIAGTEEEVMEAAVQHTVAVHGQQEGPELRAMLRQHLRAEPDWIARQSESAAATARSA